MATSLNIIQSKYNVMLFETGIIKGNKTKYYNKTDDKEIVKYSKYINLGVNSNFNIDDNVVVLSKKYYDELMGNNNNEIKLSETIKELSNNNDELMELIKIKDNEIGNLTADNSKLKDQLQQTTITNANKSDKITKLTETTSALEQQLTEYKATLKQYDINTADDLNNLIDEYKIILNYLNDCIIAYETQGRFKRFLKENPTIDIVKPPTKLINYRGNKYIANDGAIVTTKAPDSNKSE